MKLAPKRIKSARPPAGDQGAEAGEAGIHAAGGSPVVARQATGAGAEAGLGSGRAGVGSGRAGGERPRRADAARNRQRLIAAATEIFGARGFDAGVAVIARRAGVGNATLFRNFPTKDDLIRAVVEQKLREVEQIAAQALASDDPGVAFERLMFGVADLQARDLGFFEALHTRLLDDPALHERKTEMIAGANRVLERAQRAGAVRGDIVAEDLRFLLMSAVRTDVEGGAPGAHRRYLRIILDGLRPRDASELTTPPPPPVGG